jgi:hypothetical protein
VALKPSNVSQLQVSAIGYNCDGRAKTEAFIKKGFNNAYGANINVTTPYLLSLQQGNLKSALGVRNAKECLFVEQYLSLGIELELEKMGVSIARKNIAEIAHLYSNAKVFTLPLLLVTAIALHFKEFEIMVFTGTAHVLNLISKTGIDVHLITKADPQKLVKTDTNNTESDNWGSYYQSNPQVAYICLADVVQVIQGTPKFAEMFNDLSPQVANVVTQLVSL